MMATAATLQSGQPAANRRIFTILQGSMKISQELREILESAAEAFHGKSYKTAAKYYNAALDSWTAKEEKRQNQIIILTKYMLCICWLESTDAKDLLESLRTLKELEKSYGYEYPMLYYAVGKAYFKLYRFNEADEILKKGFSVLNGDLHVNEYNIPGTNIVIPESSRERLVASLVTLNEQCSSWHRPDAVCCMPDCSRHSHIEGIDKHIFFGSPTFNGIVQVSCNNPNLCIMNFHSACWKAKKEQLCSLGKMSDKDVLNWECFTPNCENQGVRCTIKKIEIYDENAELKAVIEARPEDVVWHAKPNPPPKGAIRKQQQQQTPKIKIPPTESRAAPYDRPVRPHSVANNVSVHHNTLPHRMKIEENEEEDDIHDEQALKASIEKLQELRANNFGIKHDAIWRPDLQMYGNEYMLATAELIPDPDFGNSGVVEADLKAFFFSYFYEFISANGPVKLDVLAEKWIEAQDIDVNSDAVLKPYLDITEFLLQSVKFAVIGDYICVAGKLPEAYELAKNDTCEILRFFMENDIDQRSNSSSVDDDAAFDAFINQEKNNNSLPYSSVSVDDKVIVQESVSFSNPPPDIHKKNDKKSVNNPKATEAAAPIPTSTPKAAKTKSLSKSSSNTQENGKITAPKNVEASKTVEEKIQIPPSQIEAEKNVPVARSTRKSEKRPYSPDDPAAAVADTKSEPTVKKTTENRNDPSTKLINGILKTREKEPFVFPPMISSFSCEKLTEPIEPKSNFSKECKSTNDLRESVAYLGDDNKVRMNNSGEPEDEILTKRYFLSSSRNIEADSSRAEYEKFADSHEVFNKILRNLTAELVEYRKKTLLLESELEYEKGKHAAMRVMMLQKSLQCQYTYNQSKIMMNVEECRKNIEVCASIQAMLKNTVGHNMPNYETKWTKVIEELDKISKNHEKQFNEINEQLLTSKEPQKLEKVDLQLEPLPAMPQTQLSDVVQAAFNFYRMQQMKELQRMLPPPAPALRSSQPQQIGNPQPWHPGLIQQQNYMRNLASMSQRNPANPIAPHLPLMGNVPPPVMNFPYFSYTGIPFQQVNPSQMQPIPPGTVQQQVFNAPQQANSDPHQQKISPVQRNSSPAHQIPSPVHQIARPQPLNAPSPNFVVPERPKLNSLIQSPSPLAKPQTFSNFPQQNGQFSEKSANSSMTFEELTAKFKKGTSSFEPPELSTVSSANERSSTPVLKNSTFSANDQNLEQTTMPNSQGANTVPETPKIFEGQEHAATIAQKTFSSQENMTNAGVSKICVAKFKQLDLNKKDQPFVAPENNGAKKKQQNFNSNILQAPLLFRDEPQVDTQEDIYVLAPESTPEPPAKSETALKVNEKEKDIAVVVKASNSAPQEAEARKKSVHSIDKLMKRLRKQYAGVLELDLLKSVESVRKLHNNSLSGVPISAIIREADRFILDRQQKQLCGYVKRMPNAYYTATNTGDRWTPIVEEERKRQTSVSSTSSASSIKKEALNSTSKKKWEPVSTPNDGWKKETPESDCTICLESMLHTASYTLQCKHTFHKMCIKNWYQHNQSCPTCRVHSTIDDEYPPLPLG